MMCRLLLFLIIAGALAACSTTGPGDPGPNNVTVRPGVGSMFVYQRISWDTLGNVSEDVLDTAVVFKSGISYQGKNNVVAVSWPWDTALTNALYYNYEPNGDIEDYYDIVQPFGWRTYPIASHGSAVFQGFKFTFVKDSSIIEAGKAIDAADVYLGSTNSNDSRGHDDYWIAPSLGQMVRIVATYNSPYFQNYSRTEYHLVSYQLK